MQTRTVWKEKMKFVAESDGNSVEMDAKSPIGQGSALTPKELVALGISGCTAMDVVALMKKHKQPLESLEVLSNVTMSEKKMPTTFVDVELLFQFKGQLDKSKVIEAVELSQTKYCGVSAMLVKATPIHFKIFLNGEQIGSGESKFTE